MPRHRLHKPLAVIGLWLVRKWMQRLVDAEGDLEYVARQMKRQGYPPEIAAAILSRAPMTTPERTPPCEPESLPP